MNPLGQDFEQFVAELFRREGFQADLDVRKDDLEIDVVLTSKSGVTAVVEAKLYASRNMPMTVMTLASFQLEKARQALSATKAILVVGGRIQGLTKRAMEAANPNLLIYDIDVLAFLASKYSDLLRQLEEFTRETFAFSDAITPVPNEVDLKKDLEASIPQSVTLSIQPELRGSELCKQLREVPLARAGFRPFEEKCTEIFEVYLRQ